MYDVVSALTFLAGGFLAYGMPRTVDVTFLAGLLLLPAVTVLS